VQGVLSACTLLSALFRLKKINCCKRRLWIMLHGIADQRSYLKGEHLLTDRDIRFGTSLSDK
jgi:hypothetical protein